ncbi:hypothetical protein [Marinobacter sp.]|uniref:SMP-30/gluconolactonase/LRE family protein n=1 Tax=Marinobacter sp. TaxID=50741 RepID=UPI0023569242|nr:hypothetical protein [Marinobacter sp.]
MDTLSAHSLRVFFRFALLVLGVSLNTAKADNLTLWDAGFLVPESVEYYAEGDVYFVSNVNGHPLVLDGNGFISKVSSSGRVIETSWLRSKPGSYTLHAPKGLAIAGNNLYVADLREVHVFSLPEGNHVRTIPMEGVSVLNGATPIDNESIIVTDTGYKKQGEGIAPSGTDALYRVWQDGSYEVIAMDDAMGHPNGVFYAGDNEILVVTFGSSELFRMDMSGARTNLAKPPKGTLDGVEKLADGRILVSSWEGDAIYALETDGSYTTLVSDIEDPADLGLDSEQNRLLIPLTNSDQIVIHELGR